MEQHNHIPEGYPNHIQDKIDSFTKKIKTNLPPYINGNVMELLIEDLKLWRVGVLKVSFKGGNPDLHEKIAKTASIWEQYGNIKFDFGYTAESSTYRSWSEQDDSHIRIGFEYNGYWSLVGTDSKNPFIVSNSDITLNLSQFDITLPNNYKGIILHEFGHALGFLHEHQGLADCKFDMEKIYEDLGGSPNYWSKERVDHNIKQVNLVGKRYSAHDKYSIMHYSFPAWMFKNGESSPCFTSENTNLSENDKIMMQEAYPYTQNLIAAKDKERKENLTSILSIAKLEDNYRNINIEHLNYYNQFIK